jgi:DNA-binding response OmpR family regulator
MKLKIVVIDDDKKVVIFLKKELEKSGYIVLTAENGIKGLQIIKDTNPDLLICDMLIPGIHGSELSKLLKENPLFSALQIILMTGVYKKSSWSLELQSWADGFIEKPFEIEKLNKLISNVMSGEK